MIEIASLSNERYKNLPRVHKILQLIYTFCVFTFPLLFSIINNQFLYMLENQ